jgi:SAM-dependent methyltransferase
MEEAVITKKVAPMPPPAADLLAWLASLPPGERDAAIETHLGIAVEPSDSSPPGDHLVGYHGSGVAPIVHALAEVPVGGEDVFIDLGSGLGKVVILAALLTGAAARGVELQPALVQGARSAAARLGIDVRFDVGDAREADVADGTVFFLYVPFTGPVLSTVLERLHEVARRRAIVVCALGVDLDQAGWLARREVNAFWLAVYDSIVPGAQVRRRGPRLLWQEPSLICREPLSALTLAAAADAIAREAPWSGALR